MPGELSQTQEPNIQSRIWNGSKIAIHNLEDILGAADIAPTLLYSESDFGSPIEGAKFGIQTTEGQTGPAYTIGATIQLDRSRPDMPQMLANLRESFKLRNNAHKENIHF